MRNECSEIYCNLVVKEERRQLLPEIGGKRNERECGKKSGRLVGAPESCANPQSPQRGGVVPGPVRVGSKWLLAFPRIPVTQAAPLIQTKGIVKNYDVLEENGVVFNVRRANM